MTRLSASKAKTHFGSLLDQAQREPVTIEKQGRPVAVILSYEAYNQQVGSIPSEAEKKKALQFLHRWMKRPARTRPEDALAGDDKAQALWDKYTRSA